MPVQAGAALHRRIVVEAFPLAFAGFILMAEETGIFVQRVGMEADHLHIAAPVEDLLSPVAVMVVDIEDRDARRSLLPEPLRGDRGVVEEAVAAHEAGACVMAGRAAQREGRALTGADEAAALSAVSCVDLTASHAPATKVAPASNE